MPLIRVMQDNDTPFFFSAGQFRHLERLTAPSAPHEDAKTALLIDRGDGSNLETVWLKMTAETVAELIQADSAWYGRMVDLATHEGGHAWLLPQHVINIEGVVPPTEAEIDELAAKVAEAEGSDELPAEDDMSPSAVELRARIEGLRQGLAGRRTFLGLHAKISLLIPGRSAPLACSYYTVATADEVEQAIAPPAPRRGVDASPVRADRAPKPAKLKPPASKAPRRRRA